MMKLVLSSFSAALVVLVLMQLTLMPIAVVDGAATDNCNAPSVDCPRDSSGQSQGNDDGPQMCGDEKCFYASGACANSAGYDTSDCCKVPEDVNDCNLDVNTVKCGNKGCLYTNMCVAKSAGFTNSDCETTNEDNGCDKPSDTCNQDGSGSSEGNDEGIQVCGREKCFYASGDCANSAGYETSECCKAPGDITGCDEKYKPVVCGNKDCKYSNSCIAKEAGFSDNQCSYCTDDKCCSPTSNTCNKPGDPVTATTKSVNTGSSSSGAAAAFINKAPAVVTAFFLALLPFVV